MFTFILISSFIFFSSFILHVDSQITPENNEQSVISPPSSSLDTKPYGVRITFPTDGSNVYINGSDYFTESGEKLYIEGFAVANGANNLTNCVVSIITNSIFPYQITNASGPQGDKDFSKWTYDFGSDYAHLMEGSNKITSKVTCPPGNINAYYSINVTGIEFNGTFPSNTPQETIDRVASNNLTVDSDIGLDNDTVEPSDQELPIPVTDISITSPSEGENIDLGKSLIVNGTSSYPTGYNCEVQLADGNLQGMIVPDSSNQSLFKKVNPMGSNGTADYRNWNILLEPGSTNLKNGSQSLTAKLQCYSPMSSVKFAKVNVIGISPEPIELESMDISIDKIGQGINQRITITVDDTITNEPLTGVQLLGSLNDDSFSGTTDTNGKYDLNIPEDILETSPTIAVSVSAAAEGYKTKKLTTSFENTLSVNSTDGSSSDIDENSGDSESIGSRNQELADQIFSDVQEQLSRQGINIPLPFG